MSLSNNFQRLGQLSYIFLFPITATAQPLGPSNMTDHQKHTQKQLYTLLHTPDPTGQPHPSSAMSEPGFPHSSRSVSPNVASRLHNTGSVGSIVDKRQKLSCVRDLIHSAIERNLANPERGEKPPDKREFR